MAAVAAPLAAAPHAKQLIDALVELVVAHTPLTSRPIEFIASIAGSSWNSAGAHGDAQGTITDSAGKTQVTTLSVKVAAG